MSRRARSPRRRVRPRRQPPPGEANELRPRFLGSFLIGDDGSLAHGLPQGPKGDAPSVWKAPAVQEDGLTVERLGELGHEPRLPDARITDYGREPARVGLARAEELLAQSGELGFPADKGDGGPLPATVRPGEPKEPVRRHTLRFALEGERLDELSLDLVTHEPVRERTEEDLHLACRLLQTSGHVDGVPGDEALARTGIARNDLARVHSDPSREAHSPAALELVVHPREGGSHLRGCPDRAKRVVLAHDRETEDRHDRVADELLDDAAVTLQHATHLLEVARHEPVERLGVERLPERRRSGQVCKDDSDGLADLLGRRLGLEPRPTETAQPKSLRILLTAARTNLHRTRVYAPFRRQQGRAKHGSGRERGAPAAAFRWSGERPPLPPARTRGTYPTPSRRS